MSWPDYLVICLLLGMIGYCASRLYANWSDNHVDEIEEWLRDRWPKNR